MNNSLLDKSLFSPISISKKKAPSTQAEDYYSASEPDSPHKIDQGYNLVRLAQTAKSTITMNKIKFILFLNILPLLFIFISLINKEWYLMVQEEDYVYWVNFFFIAKGVRNPSSPAHNDTYSGTTKHFYSTNCKLNDDIIDDQKVLCSVLTSYYFTGMIALCITLMGVLLHFIHIVHLTQIWKQGTPDAVKCLNPQKIPFLITFFYMGALVYWIFATASPINDNTVDDLNAYDRYGSSFVFYGFAVVMVLLLSSWFKKVFSKNVRGSLINDLLNAEIRYIQGLRSDHEEA